MRNKQKQHGCRERERERATFYQSKKGGYYLINLASWRREGVI